MSNTYGASMLSGTPLGGGMMDLVSTQKGGVQNLGRLAQAIRNVFPAPTTSTSPVFIAVNNLGTTGTTVMTATTGLHGLIAINPGTATAYLYSLTIATTPTLSSLGGTIPIPPSQSFPFPSINYANFNVGLGALVATGTSAPLTILQFF